MADKLKPHPIPTLATDPAADMWLGVEADVAKPVIDTSALDVVSQHPFMAKGAAWFERIRRAFKGDGIMPPSVMLALRTPDQVGIGDAWTFNYSLSSPALLGPGYDGPSWDPWREFLNIVDGHGAWRDEAFCRRCLGFSDDQLIPKVRPDEIWMVVGRRGGKSAIAAGMALTLAQARWPGRPGENTRILVQAARVDRAQQIFGYVIGMLSNPGMFPGMEGMLAEVAKKLSVKLTSETVIEVGSANEASARGPSLAAAICDEIALWAQVSGQYARGQAALKDQLVLGAIRPALALTGGPLIALSSPRLRRGAMWNAYQQHFGRSWEHDTGRRVMVWQASSLDMHPGNDRLKREVEQAYEDDPIEAAIEYGANFAGEPNMAIPRETVEAAVEAGVTVRPPVDGVKYWAFIDASMGGGPDSAAFGIAHAEGQHVILDVLLTSDPPFQVPVIIKHWWEIAQMYRCARVSGDQYMFAPGAKWIRFLQDAGFSLDNSPRNTSGNYYDLIIMLLADRVRLLDSARLVDELAGLESHVTSRSRHPVITHRLGAHDDSAAAAAGALCHAGLSAGAPLTVGRTSL